MNINIKNFAASLLIVFSLDQCSSYVKAEFFPYSIEVLDVASSNKLYDPNLDQVKNESQNCSLALEMFAEKVSNLSRCAVINARPIRICTLCEKERNATIEAYKLLEETPECHKFYFESDQVGIIDMIYSQANSIWTRNNCYDCYLDRATTEKFFEIAKKFDACFEKHNQTVTGSNNTCHMCQDLYEELSEKYKFFVDKITDDESGAVCMDIVDQMNITRHQWSNENCFKFDTNIGYSNIVTAALVGIIPILFYLLSKNVSILEDVKLVRPKRKSFASLHDSLPSEQS